MSINKQMELYHKIEQVLREAAKTKNAMTVHDIFMAPIVNAIAKNELQVRDKVRNLHEHHLLTRITVPSSEAGIREIESVTTGEMKVRLPMTCTPSRRRRL